MTDILDRKIGTKEQNEHVKRIQPIIPSPTAKSNSTMYNQNTPPHKPEMRDSSAETGQPTPKWPKFEDILLEIGKKYDWKDDRWIKVRRKIKHNKLKDSETKEIANERNSVNFHEKHKFSYKIVKLNRSKNRRSVVVAVSAVR